MSTLHGDRTNGRIMPQALGPEIPRVSPGLETWNHFLNPGIYSHYWKTLLLSFTCQTVWTMKICICDFIVCVEEELLYTWWSDKIDSDSLHPVLFHASEPYSVIFVWLIHRLFYITSSKKSSLNPFPSLKISPWYLMNTFIFAVVMWRNNPFMHLPSLLEDVSDWHREAAQWVFLRRWTQNLLLCHPVLLLLWLRGAPGLRHHHKWKMDASAAWGSISDRLLVHSQECCHCGKCFPPWPDYPHSFFWNSNVLWAVIPRSDLLLPCCRRRTGPPCSKGLSPMNSLAAVLSTKQLGQEAGNCPSGSGLLNTFKILKKS